MLSVQQGQAGARPSPLTAIRHRANKVANLWIFDSPKNRCRLTVVGDVPFMHLILLEGNPQVCGYQLVGDPFELLGGPRNVSSPGYIRVVNSDGPDTWLRIKRSSGREGSSSTENSDRDRLRAGATAARATYAEYSELELRGREIEFENWLILCACMTRVRGNPDYAELTAFVESLESNAGVSVRTLLAVPGVDQATMLAVIAAALQQGTASTELRRSPFGLDSLIQRRPT